MAEGRDEGPLRKGIGEEYFLHCLNITPILPPDFRILSYTIVTRTWYIGCYMKKLGFVIVIACMAIGTASAQNWGNGWGTSPQTVQITGTLQLRNGVIAVASGNNAYYVPALTQYIGFIEGLREGAQISIDGYVSGNYVQPTKVTISGKSYDFAANAQQCYSYCGNGWGNSRTINSRGGWGNQGGYGCRW